jgi:murein DD-endopeptidase MepM/ murein hydrolase activator NlpD
MVDPVPGARISAVFRQRPQNPATTWRACGWHTGLDYAAPSGHQIVAARPGIVRHVRMGSAFGPAQFVIQAPASAGGGQDLYAHTLDRPANGATVQAGQRVARVGALGQATGPHLHLERHPTHSTRWPACGQFQDPQRSHDWQPGSGQPPTQQEDQMTPEQARQLADILWAVQQIRGTDLPPVTASTGGRLLAPVDQTRWLVGESIAPAVASIGRRLTAIEQALGIPVQSTVMPAMPDELADVPT